MLVQAMWVLLRRMRADSKLMQQLREGAQAVPGPGGEVRVRLQVQAPTCWPIVVMCLLPYCV